MNIPQRLACLALCFASLAAHADDAPAKLPALAAEPGSVTISGLSSGGFMAVQFHVAHSALIRGAGVLAGGPYYCAKGSMFNATWHCMSPNFFLSAPKPEELRAEVEKQAAAKTIDAPEKLRDSRVWLLSGGHDGVVTTDVVDATHAFYLQYLPASAVLYERLPEAGHAMIAPQATTAGACEVTATPFINQCGAFDAPRRLLTHLLGALKPRAATASGELLTFDQSEFAPPQAGMAATARLYIPTGCRAGGCRLHVALHGCKQNIDTIGETYVTESGYNQWAESNRLIVLYPQTANTLNSLGCWDWFGYTGADYHTRNAPQIKAIRAMIDRLLAKP
ncbi:MAG: PHB depolymerase family esterase [Azoarcus sp.]|jgi:poly(3-hydroxybutyrate) depolymerase|nr:PHB depolymerase family esterase [Azoarcus sp.]